MIERIQTPESNRMPKPDLVRYSDGEFALVLDKPGTEVNFNARASGDLDPDNQSFDTTAYDHATMVALACKDYDGKKAIFVAGTAFGDLVCQLDIVDGRASYAIFEDPNFNAALAEKPMIIGARHDRLGDRKLTKAYALPQMAIGEASGAEHAPEGVSSPLAIATRLFHERLEQHN
jgi:hypothetical protein